jgi:hypothetical protein
MDRELDKPKIVSVALTFLGVLVFAALLGYVLFNPGGFEQRVQGFVIAEIEARLGQRTMPEGSNTEEIEARIQETLKALSDFINASVASMCRTPCEDQLVLIEVARRIYNQYLTDLRMGADIFRAVVEDRYHAILSELRADIGVFLICNLLVMSLAFVLALFRTKDSAHLLPVSILLTVSTLIASYWYVMGQNWFMTLVYADFYGWTYLVLLGVIFLVLLDIGLNRARATGDALHAMTQIIF